MDIPKNLKKQLRQEALARRDALDPTWRIEASLGMAEAARDRLAVEPGEIVSGFWPIRSEVDVRPLMFALREQGRAALPAGHPRQDDHRLSRTGARRAAGRHGFRHASGPGAEAEVLDPDVMLVPLAAFDRRGHRIGYGAGHYDRAIARLHRQGAAAAADRHCLRLPGGGAGARRAA